MRVKVINLNQDRSPKKLECLGTTCTLWTVSNKLFQSCYERCCYSAFCCWESWSNSSLHAAISCVCLTPYVLTILLPKPVLWFNHDQSLSAYSSHAAWALGFPCMVLIKVQLAHARVVIERHWSSPALCLCILWWDKNPTSGDHGEVGHPEEALLTLAIV